jgi:catechol 2,3-dioxygenase-like lactoylglutathione lyase family enzyme
MKVAHIILRVRDLAVSTAFYRDRVGLEMASESPGFAFFDGGSITVMLNASPSEPADITNTEVVLEVDDVAAAYREMSDRGIPFEVELRPVMEQEGRALHAAHFRDPDGHLWSVTGWV